METLEEDFQKALRIISNLVDNISFLPHNKDGVKFFEVSDEIKDFLEKHLPQQQSKNRSIR